MLNKKAVNVISRILIVLTLFSVFSSVDFTAFAAEYRKGIGDDIKLGYNVASDTNAPEDKPNLPVGTSTDPEQPPVSATDTEPSEIVPKPIVYPNSIKLSKTSVMITEGEKLPLTYAPFNIRYKLKYTSNSVAVASVDSCNGLITAKKPGKATITCNLQNGVKASCDVVVIPSKLSLKTTTVKMNAKDKYQLNCTGNDVLFGVKYSSDNKNIADVSENGLITSYVSGNVKIKCTLPNGASAVVNVKVSVRGSYYKGIDVSEFQGKIDWNKVKKSGIGFAIIRCGYGDDEKKQDDESFLRNVKECERLGIPYGVYLYSYAASTAEAQSEAKHTLRLLKGLKPILPVFLDLEDRIVGRCSNKVILKNAKIYVNALEKAGYKAGIYANLDWWENKLTDSWYKTKPCWVAQYYRECQYKEDYDLWQYTSDGKVDGINGYVDMNYLYKSYFFIADSAAKGADSTNTVALSFSNRNKTLANCNIMNFMNMQLQCVLMSSANGVSRVMCKIS